MQNFPIRKHIALRANLEIKGYIESGSRSRITVIPLGRDTYKFETVIEQKSIGRKITISFSEFNSFIITYEPI